MKTTRWLKNNGSWILTILGVVGVIGTAILSAKAAPKAEEAKRTAAWEKGELLTPAEKLGAELPCYLGTIGCGAATIGCMVGAQCLNKRNEAALMASMVALEQTFQKYRNNVAYLEGDHADIGASKAMLAQKRDQEDGNPPWDVVQTFYLEGYDHPIFFERTMEAVFKAEYHLNRNFTLRGNATWGEFLEFLHLDPESVGDRLGWDRYIGETLYGYAWIDFDHRYYTNDDGLLICAIDMPFPPHPLDENEFETGLVMTNTDFDRR